MTTHAAVAASADVQSAIPALASLADGIGDPAVRNRGTIGGSIANNDPAADYPSAVVALGATVKTTKTKEVVECYIELRLLAEAACRGHLREAHWAAVVAPVVVLLPSSRWEQQFVPS